MAIERKGGGLLPGNVLKIEIPSRNCYMNRFNSRFNHIVAKKDQAAR